MPSMWGVLPPTPVAPARRGLPSISRTTCVPASKRQHPITRPHARARKHISTVFIERAAALTIARRVLSLSRSRYTAEFDRPGVCQRPICAVCRPVTAAPILAQPHDNVGCTTISIGVAKLARGSGLGVRDTRGRGLTHPQVGVYAVCHESRRCLAPPGTPPPRVVGSLALSQAGHVHVHRVVVSTTAYLRSYTCGGDVCCRCLMLV